MSRRAVLLGLLFALVISVGTYLLGRLFGASSLTGNHLPVAVFGVFVVLVLFVNPTLAACRLGTVLSPAELAVICAFGLAACAWPDSNLMRYFSAVVSVPAHVERASPTWQSVEVLSYVPGGSPRLAEGYVVDWQGLAKALVAAESSDNAEEEDLARVWRRLTLADQLLLREIADGVPPTRNQRKTILDAINDMLPDPALFTASAVDGGASSPAAIKAANRGRLTELLPSAIRPPPRGEGVLLNGGDPETPALDRLLTGAPLGETVSPVEVPWGAWWPTLRLWGGLVLLIGVASLCMVLVVHTQWSRHEMLPYPIVRFVDELSAPAQPGAAGGIASIASSRLFWMGIVGVAVVHAANGFHTWWDALPQITRQLDFLPLKVLFPNASRDPKVNYLFAPILYPSVIGFGYLLSTRVTLSLGLALPLWLLVAGTLTANGIVVNDGRFVVDATRPAIRYGAFVGAAVMILYYGRRHYLHVLAGAVGWRGAAAPTHAVWGARVGAACFLAAVALLAYYGSVGMVAAAVVLGMVLLSMLVVMRIHVETGMFFIQPEFLPATVMAALVGVNGLGPQGYIVLMLTSVVLFADPRATLMPFLANGLKMGENLADVKPQRIAPWLGLIVVGGLVMSVVAGLTVQYNLGLNQADTYANRFLATAAFDQAARSLAEASMSGEVAAMMERQGLDVLWHAEPSWRPIRFAFAGAVLYLGCAIARVRLPWWPLHPVIFLVWGTLASSLFAVSFLLAAGIKFAAVRAGGERAYRRLLPLMIGLIAGDLLSALGGVAAGAVYYFGTDSPLPPYQVFP